jgi:hypothetical protein
VRNYIITGLVCLVIGVLAGSALFPKVKEKTVETEVERVVKDVQTVIKVVTRPDGTKEEVTTIIDKSKQSTDKTSTKIIAKNDWHISASGSRTFTDSSMTYTLQVERRIIGDVFLGASVDSEKQVGLVVGIDW